MRAKFGISLLALSLSLNLVIHLALGLELKDIVVLLSHLLWVYQEIHPDFISYFASKVPIFTLFYALFVLLWKRQYESSLFPPGIFLNINVITLHLVWWFGITEFIMLTSCLINKEFGMAYPNQLYMPGIVEKVRVKLLIRVYFKINSSNR